MTRRSPRRSHRRCFGALRGRFAAEDPQGVSSGEDQAAERDRECRKPENSGEDGVKPSPGTLAELLRVGVSHQGSVEPIRLTRECVEEILECRVRRVLERETIGMDDVESVSTKQVSQGVRREEE